MTINRVRFSIRENQNTSSKAVAINSSQIYHQPFSSSKPKAFAKNPFTLHNKSPHQLTHPSHVSQIPALPHTFASVYSLAATLTSAAPISKTTTTFRIHTSPRIFNPPACACTPIRH